ETMSAVRYAIEVMNKRVRSFGDRFYKSLTDAHYYEEDANYNLLDGLLSEGILGAERDSRWDADCRPDKAMDLSFDFGNFTCMWVGQEHPGDYKLINTFHTEENEILDDIVERFCNYYRYKANKMVNIYGDKMGKYKGGNTRLSQFDTVKKILIKHGWRFSFQFSGDISHLDRHDFINSLFRWEDKLLPTISFNRTKCKDAIIALETTGMIDDKKDKRPERHAIEQKHAPHYGDALDYLLFPKFKRYKSAQLQVDRVGVS